MHVTGAGSCTVTASQAGNSDYNAASPVQQSFSIAKAPLSITANKRSKTYGDSLTLGTSAFTPSGIVGSDSISSVTLASAGGGLLGGCGHLPGVTLQIPVRAAHTAMTIVAPKTRVALLGGPFSGMVVGSTVSLTGTAFTRTSRATIRSTPSSTAGNTLKGGDGLRAVPTL